MPPQNRWTAACTHIAFATPNLSAIGVKQLNVGASLTFSFSVTKFALHSRFKKLLMYRKGGLLPHQKFASRFHLPLMELKFSAASPYDLSATIDVAEICWAGNIAMNASV